MKYFDVYKLYIRGQFEEYDCLSDGSDDGRVISNDDREHLWFIGFEVWEYEEDGTTIERKKYYVDRGRTGATADDLLDRIKEEHPACEWQNNNW